MANPRVATDTILLVVTKHNAIDIFVTDSTPIEVQNLKKQVKGKRVDSKILQACCNYGYEVVAYGVDLNTREWTLQKFS